MLERAANIESETVVAFGKKATPTYFDNFLSELRHKQVNAFLHQPGWAFGWKSSSRSGSADSYAFWHKHFAGSKGTDHPGKEQQLPYDCAEELQRNAPLLHAFWQHLESTILKGHTLVRCYANGYPYGSEGTLHTDAISPKSFTSMYYPHERWFPNWAGETVWFDEEKTDIIASVYPKPNRMVVFPGTTPHVARGISRTCPILRVTLMFKTELGGI